MFRLLLNVPSAVFAFVFALGLAMGFGAVHLTLQEPLFKVAFEAGMTVESTQGSMSLEPFDFIAEPSEITTNSELNRFYERQELIAKIISESNITVTQNGSSQEYASYKRSISDLPAMFWIYVFVGLGGLFISGWVWALKPRSLAPFYFFLSGLAMCVSALAASVYTSRGLAVPYALFFPLENLNAWGAAGFGMAMVALFLIYPKKIKGAGILTVVQFVTFVLWSIAFTMQWTHDDFGINTIIVSLMLLICIAITAQFFATKNDPASRAALLWLGLSVILGAGAFVGLIAVPLVLGLKPLNQGYAFIAFLVIYLGLAAGLVRFRLFEVGHWAFRFLFYVGGTIVFVLLDAALVVWLGMDRFPALGLALVAVGFLYLPLRDLLWRLIIEKKSLQSHELLSECLHVAFAPSQEMRVQRWEDLLRKLFKPLELIATSERAAEVSVSADGLTLTLPAVAGVPTMQVSYPSSGRSLFNPQSIATGRQMIEFIKQAESSRHSYERGVREERKRIAQDLHDDVGARLLTGLHTSDANLRTTIQEAIGDIRSIVKGIAGEELRLRDLLADLRVESVRRLEAVSIELSWPTSGYDHDSRHIDYHHHKVLSSIIREVISNVIRHSQSKTLAVDIRLSSQMMELSFKDSGTGFSERVLNGESGFGLKGIIKRTEGLGGEYRFENLNSGAHVYLKIRV